MDASLTGWPCAQAPEAAKRRHAG